MLKWYYLDILGEMKYFINSTCFFLLSFNLSTRKFKITGVGHVCGSHDISTGSTDITLAEWPCVLHNLANHTVPCMTGMGLMSERK